MASLESRLGAGTEGFDQPVMKPSGAASTSAGGSASSGGGGVHSGTTAAAASSAGVQGGKVVKVTKDSQRASVPLARNKVNEFIYSELMDLDEEEEAAMMAPVRALRAWLRTSPSCASSNTLLSPLSLSLFSVLPTDNWEGQLSE